MEVIPDIHEEQKRSACGNELSRIEEQSIEKLEVISVQIRVRPHGSSKYDCKSGQGAGDEERLVEGAKLLDRFLRSEETQRKTEGRLWRCPATLSVLPLALAGQAENWRLGNFSLDNGKMV